VTPADETNAQQIVDWFGPSVKAKYAKGAAEHGGELPFKGGLLGEAESEVLDFAVYVRTIRAQLQSVLHLIQSDPGLAYRQLRCILHGTPADRL
jgi:hypothetical protein